MEPRSSLTGNNNETCCASFPALASERLSGELYYESNLHTQAVSGLRRWRERALQQGRSESEDIKPEEAVRRRVPWCSETEGRRTAAELI
jgi:hypothetical protein